MRKKTFASIYFPIQRPSFDPWAKIPIRGDFVLCSFHVSCQFFGVVSTKIKNVVLFSRFPTLSKVHQRPHQLRVKKKKKLEVPLIFRGMRES